MSAALVSICIPAHNNEATISRALDCALDQDYPRVEVVVVDDCSRDGTAGILRRYSRDGVRVHTSPIQLGAGRARTMAAAAGHGELIKFLDADDELDRTCVSALAGAFAGDPSIGLTFCRPRLHWDDPPSEPLPEGGYDSAALHRGLAPLCPVNSGDELLDRWIARELRLNWVGGSTNVMVRRSALAHVGAFHLYMAQARDMDLWIRLMAHFDVGFLDAELATYHCHERGLTALNRREHRDWLDRLWMLEGLTFYPQITRRHPQVLEWRRHELSIALRTALRHQEAGWPRARRLRDVGRYLWFRVHRHSPDRASPFEGLEEATASARRLPRDGRSARRPPAMISDEVAR